MATRSNIAYKTAEGKIRSAYCHWDGYPEHNGEMLRRHYMDLDKVKALVDLGSMSLLAPKVNPTTESHSFDSPEEDVTVFYHRDRGESWDHTAPQEYDNFADFVDNGEEYMYFFDGKDWIVNDHRAKDDMGFPIFDFVEQKIRPEILAKMGWDQQ